MRRFERENLCEMVRERLELFLDGELTGSESFAFHTHLKECDDCAAHWADDEEIATALMVGIGRELSDEALTEEGRQPIAELSEVSSDSSGSTWRGFAVGLGVAASVMLVWTLTRGTGETSVDHGPVTISEGERADNAEDVTPFAAQPVFRGAAPLIKNRATGAWVAIESPTQITEGCELFAGEQRDVVVDLPANGRLALDSGSVVRIHAFASAAAAGDLQVDLIQGRVTVDVDEAQACRVRLLDNVVRIEDGTLTATSDHHGEMVVVLRGQAVVTTSEESKSLTVGEVAELGRDGVLRLASQPELLASLTATREELERARVELSGVEMRLTNLVAAAEPGEMIEESVEAIIASYLDIVEEAGLRFVDPNSPLARKTAVRLLSFGPDGVARLSSILGNENGEGRQHALIGLIARIDTPAARQTLEQLCFDSRLNVRRSALHRLSKKSDADLVQHFLDVHRGESDFGLRVMAAYYAARGGSTEGVQALVELYHDEPSGDLCDFIPSLVSRLDTVDPAIDRFLRAVVADPESESATVAVAIKALLRRGDDEALPVLRDLMGRTGVSLALRRKVNEAILGLQSQY